MIVWDVETNGFLEQLDTLHCINLIDTKTAERMRFNAGRYADGSPTERTGSLEDGLHLLAEAECIGGHNIIGFDIPAIQKLHPQWSPKGRLRDSLVECRVIWTNLWDMDERAIMEGRRPATFKPEGLMGSHKLKAWGIRLGNNKAEFEGPFDAFTKVMDDYCAQDVETNLTLFERINSKDYSAQCLELENRVAEIIYAQERHGFLFDRAKAEALLRKLEVRHAELADTLRGSFKPWFAPVRKGGKVEVLTPKTNNKALGRLKDCTLSKVEEVVFNPASRDHIADRMMKLFGWTPVEFTDSGKPKVDETTLEGLDYPEAKLLVEYLTVEKRLGQLATGKQAWLSAVKADCRVHGRVNTNGAVTGRMTHSSPNMAQVPSSGSLYGHECRDLFTTPAGKSLLGCDAEGLELRMLGHYMARFDGGAYCDTVVNGKKEDGSDVHTVNQRFIGLNSRNSAKTWIYAYLYGAGHLKLGTIIYEDMTESKRATFNARYAPGTDREKALARLGGKAKRSIEEGLPALGKLQELVKTKAKRGYLKSLDGRILHVRSQHAALNTLLQGAGAIVMKQALVLCDESFRAKGWKHGREYAFVANVHDEFQIEIDSSLAEEAGQLAAQSITQAGHSFALGCPLSGSYDIGKSWAETH
jgi:hypothetical protein